MTALLGGEFLYPILNHQITSSNPTDVILLIQKQTDAFMFYREFLRLFVVIYNQQHFIGT